MSNSKAASEETAGRNTSWVRQGEFAEQLADDAALVVAALPLVALMSAPGPHSCRTARWRARHACSGAGAFAGSASHRGGGLCRAWCPLVPSDLVTLYPGKQHGDTVMWVGQ